LVNTLKPALLKEFDTVLGLDIDKAITKEELKVSEEVKTSS
jgi:hypothetical protein